MDMDSANKPETKMGRPPIEFTKETWNMLDILCMAQCSRDEIAAHLGVSHDSLSRAIKAKYSMTFASYFAKKRKAGFASLRSRQFQAAMNGNSKMLEWLGKQWLKQTDKVDSKIDLTHDVTFKAVFGEADGDGKS